MAGRFTGPVRFIYDGDIGKGPKYRAIARQFIGNFDTPLKRKRGAQIEYKQYKLYNGVTIKVQKVHGVHQAYVHIPEGGGKDQDLKGFVVYPYVGWIWPYKTWNCPQCGSHRRRRRIGWQPPYYNPDRSEYKEDGYNKGAIYPAGYEDFQYITDTKPGYPQAVIPHLDEYIETSPPEEPKYKVKVLAKPGDNVKYEPTQNIWLGNPYESEEEMFYRCYAAWESPDSWEKKYVVHWKTTGSNDIYIAEDDFRAVYDLGNYVYVNGAQYNTPWPIRSAVVKHDAATDTYWLVIVANRESFGGYSPWRVYVYTRRITDGMGTNDDIVSTITDFDAAGDAGHFALRELAYNWYSLNDDPDYYILTPINAQGASGWTPGSGYFGGYFYDSYGYNWNADGTKFTFFVVIEGVTAVERDVVNLPLSVVTREVEGKTYYLPSTTWSLDTYAYGKFINPAVDGDWKNWPSIGSWYDCGTVILGTAWDGNTLKDTTMKLELNVTPEMNGDGDFIGFSASTVRLTTNVDGTDYILETARTTELTWNGDPPVASWNPLTYTASVDMITMYDYRTKDGIRESGTAAVTQFNPGPILDMTYSNEIIYEGTIIDTSSGSWTYNRNTPASNIPPIAIEMPYMYGSISAGDWTSHTDAGVVRNNYTMFSATDKRFTLFYYPRGQADCAIEIHRGHPGGYQVGTYVPRSINAGPDDIYAQPSGGELDYPENWRTIQKNFITIDQNLETLLEITGYNDEYGKAMVPIFGTIYYKDFYQRVR